MVHNASSSNGSKKDASNKNWITKEEFYKVFPNGYREGNFFSSPIDFWAMSKEACWNWKQTALLDLSLKLNCQKNLQQTSLIGHSSDSKLLTELLNQNDKDSNIDSPNKNTSINNNMNMDPDVLAENISISKNKKCYTCNNICKCSGLLTNRSKNNLRHNNCDTTSLLSKSQLVLPEIQLIDKFDKSSIKSSVTKTNCNLSNYIFNNKDGSVTRIAIPNISEMCYDMFKNGCDRECEKIFYDNNDIPLSSTDTLVNIQPMSTTPLDIRVVTERDAGQVIHDKTNESVNELSIIENNEHNTSVLKYFHLTRISDIFQDLDDDCMSMEM